MTDRLQLLVISNYAPFQNYGKAGQKTHQYYFNEFLNSDEFEVRLIGFSNAKDLKKLDYIPSDVTKRIFEEEHSRLKLKFYQIKKGISFVLNPKDKYAHFMTIKKRSLIRNQLIEWKNFGYYPDIILLEFTQIILMSHEIKCIFPDARLVASSHDVMYIGAKRVYENENCKLKRVFRKKQYENLKIREVEALEKCDLIVAQNENDINIFKSSDSLKKKAFLCISPFYDDYSNLSRQSDGHTIVFYGAMGRKENSESVVWFINNVFWHLKSGFDFYIIGSNPTNELLKYESNNIHVTGFLEESEISDIFSKCVCMIVPLKLGSGIKVKVLEAFSGGIPVITNSIGIEGIPAKANDEYCFCESAEDYINVLNKIANGMNIEYLGINAQKFVKLNFNKKDSAEKYIKELMRLL